MVPPGAKTRPKNPAWWVTYMYTYRRELHRKWIICAIKHLSSAPWREDMYKCIAKIRMRISLVVSAWGWYKVGKVFIILPLLLYNLWGRWHSYSVYSGPFSAVDACSRTLWGWGIHDIQLAIYQQLHGLANGVFCNIWVNTEDRHEMLTHACVLSQCCVHLVLFRRLR